MASCFKKSCWIYWLTFILSFSYLFASEIFTDRYIIETDKISRIQKITVIICSVNIIYSIIGCIYLKCNIVHLVCVVLYIGPLVLVNLVLNTYLVIDTQSVEALKPPQMLDEAIKHIKIYGTYPSWLEYTQLYEGCCGVYGFMDYPAYLYPTGNPNGLEKLRIPSSCCSQFSERTKEKDCGKSTDSIKNLNYGNNQNNSNATQATPAANSSSWPEIYFSLANTSRSLNCASKKKTQKCNSLQKYEDPSKKEDKYDPSVFSGSNYKVQFDEQLICVYNQCGCYNYVREQKETLYGSAYLLFIITNYLTMIIEVIFYFKNYCAYKKNRDSGSTHSLDTENISLLNLQVPKAKRSSLI